MDRILVDIGSNDEVFEKMISEVQNTITFGWVGIVIISILLFILICVIFTSLPEVISNWKHTSSSDRIIMLLIIVIALLLCSVIAMCVYMIVDNNILLNTYSTNRDIAISDYIERFSHD